MAVHVKSGASSPVRQLRTKSGTALGRATTQISPSVFLNGPTVYADEPLGAGGWVTGIAISPDGQTRLTRTDTCGGWRWSASANKWVRMLNADSMPSPYNVLDLGVAANRGVFALAAANDICYMGFDNAIFTSVDKGVTWSTSLATGPKTSPNISGIKRWTSHMAIDPNNSSICIYGTVNAGLYFTLDRGVTWSASGALPIGTDGAATPGNSTFGIPVVVIDTSGNWYAAPFGSGLYKSTDHGTSWTKISNDTDFIAATGMALGPNGDIMVVGTPTTPMSATNAKVFRYRSGAWTTMVGPNTAKQLRVVAYDPVTAGRVMVQGDGGWEYISLDYGDNWTAMDHTFASTNDVPWLAASAGGSTGHTFYADIGGLQFDPVVANRVWMSQGIGVWYADLPTSLASRIPWQAQSRGIEQLVVNDALAPPGGSAIGNALAICWDRPIFLTGEVGTSGTPYPYQYHPVDAGFSSGWHFDYSADNPHWIAASIGDRNLFTSPDSGYSTDGGETWTRFATIPIFAGNNSPWFSGSIHVGAPGHIIWVSYGGKGTVYSTNSGATWTAITLPGATVTNLNTAAYFTLRRPMCSEKTAGLADTFYCHMPLVGFYKSTDAGATWTLQSNNTPFAGFDWTGGVYLKAVPDHPGHLFYSMGWQGAGGGAEATGRPWKRSTDGGVTWTTVGTIDTVRAFDFGVGKPGSTYPAIYAIGYVGGVKGVYRSDDNAATWTLLSTQPNKTLDFIQNIAASKETYGKHWITTSGSGLLVGTPT